MCFWNTLYTRSGQRIRIQHKELKQTVVIVSHGKGIKYFNGIIFWRNRKIISDANREGVTSPAIR